MMEKSMEDVKSKIGSGDAVVWTADELKKKLSEGESVTLDDVDVVTCGTSGVMSGTSALLHIPVSEPGSFNKAKEVYINGIEAYPGPCPNELLGTVDVYVYGTNHSRTIDGYGGGFLFKDLVDKKEVEVEVVDVDGNTFSNTVTIDDMPFARMIGSRMAFKNYSSFTNPGRDATKSIFNASPMEGPYNSYSFSGCGDINPLANDPDQLCIGESTPVLLNGARGVVISNGTRSSPEKPNLMLTADMKEMDSYWLGGYKTAMGPEVFDSVAIAIPVLNEKILSNLMVLNKDIELPVCDIHGRHLPIDNTSYAVWDDVELRPSVDVDKCFSCIPCLPNIYCPVNAFNKDKTINYDLCFGCGYCATVCPRGVPSIDMGSISINAEGKDRVIPVTCRQSDRKRGVEISGVLKKRILDGEFDL
ncbi:MAG: hypothetical protein BZ136_06180 [Methanosphaera sp. rholeuAM74]|nr:MAG: hypothetical protein BZ136_06180 [Methanosphaera sp. rholeuAM74]